jgi:hypothetical protein
MIKGSIKTIARVGESHKDFDMKVFKVMIQLDNTHEGLKPAMNSNNDIVLAKLENVISIPLISVFKENGTKYVYLKTSEGSIKQEIKTGFENEEFVLVEEGLKEEELYIIVGAAEAKPSVGKISNESPLGKSLLGHKAGDSVSVNAPAGAYKVKIIKFE